MTTSTTRWDLVVIAADRTTIGYPVYAASGSPLGVSAQKTQLNNAIYETPGQSGGTYSVRDQEQPAIVIGDWSGGAGQRSYEVVGSSSARFHSSNAIDISRKGELRLARAGALTADAEADGIVFSALGKVFQTYTPGEPDDSVRYWNGTSWDVVPWSSDPGESVNCLATDGEYLYAALPTAGVYRVKDSDADDVLTDETLAQWDSKTGIVGLCYSGGYMYGATATACGYFTATPDWNQISPAGLEPSLTTFGLVPADRWAYWGHTGNGFTRISRVQFDGTNEWYEEVCDFPIGFVGTCMASYLGNIFVGGYYECATQAVGQGAVYMIADDTVTLLTTIGDNPDYTSDPGATENDNRIWSLCPHGKDLYLLATRSVFRWDLDDGGYVHVVDVPQGSSSSMTWLSTGDLDYTASALPDSGTWTASGSGVGVVGGGWLTVTSLPGTSFMRSYAATPAGGDVLSNATGTTMEVVVDDLSESAGEFGFDDGTKACRVRLWQETQAAKKGSGSYSCWYIALGEYVGGAWEYSPGYIGVEPDALTLRLTCQEGTSRLYIDGELTQTVTSLATSTGTNGVFFAGGWSGQESGGSIKYDSVYISNDGAFSPGAEYAPSTIGSLAVALSAIWVGVHAVGYVVSGTDYTTEGWMRLSVSSAHSGSLPKVYHSIIVDHEPLLATEGLACDWYIDGTLRSGGAGVTDGARTVFAVEEAGRNIAPVLYLSGDGSSSPIVKGITETFSFGHYRTHSYVLDCRDGAGNGRWNYDPEVAIAHLFTVAEEGGSFKDRFSGDYNGVIEKCDLVQAQRNDRGTLEGIVQLVVRELE